MQTTGDITLSGANRLKPARNWRTLYTRPSATVFPNLVLDFERGFYGGAQLSTDPLASFTLTRNSSKSVIGPTGAAQNIAPQTPAFDWSTGRRGLHLAPTIGSTDGDVAKVPLSSWWSGLQGTLVVNFQMIALDGAFDRVLEINQGGGSVNRISVLFNSSLGQLVFGVYNNSNAQSVILGSETAYTLGTRTQLAATYQANRFSVCVNGGSVLVNTGGSVPTGLDSFWLGAANATTNKPTILLHDCRYYNTALSDAQLQALTA